MANTRISIKEDLGNVDYEGNDKTKELKQEVEEFIFHELTQLQNIHFSDGDLAGQVNEIKNGTEYGFAFGISKFDDGFVEKDNVGPGSMGGFRYKDDEVQAVLKKLIKKLNMAPKIRWGRGQGVFVFNIFLK
jgi:hypothetical protein